MEEGLIKVEAVVKATETLMLGLAKGLVFVHLPVAIEVGPSLLIRQNLREDNLSYDNCKETMIQKVKLKVPQWKHTVCQSCQVKLA